MGEETGRGRV